MGMDRAVGIVLVVAILSLLGYVSVLKNDIRTLNEKLDNERSLKIIESQNLHQCTRELETTNEQIEAQRNNYQEKLESYKKKLKQKPKVRYKTIYKTCRSGWIV